MHVSKINILATLTVLLVYLGLPLFTNLLLFYLNIKQLLTDLSQLFCLLC